MNSQTAIEAMAMRMSGQIAAAVALVAVALGAMSCGESAAKQKQADAAKANRPVPVVAAPVVKKDVPIFLDGIGTVAAYKTVTVKPQVDGVLEKVLFREGDPVKKGELIAQIDPRPFLAALHSAEGALARDQATLDNALLNRKRYEELLEKKLIPEQTLTDAKAAAGTANGTVLLDKASIETAKLNLAYTSITSPVDGVTGIRVVDPGNVVHTSDANGLVVITQLDPIAVIFTLPQDNLPEIAPQMEKGELTVEAWSRDGSTRLGAGRLLLIDNQINTTTGTLRLKAIFSNPNHVLWPNQFVKSRLQVSVQKDALVVASTVVQRGPEGTFAWVINQDGTAKVQPVTVARTLADTVIVTGGLIEGEQVVVEGQTALRPGVKVNPRDPNANASDNADGGARGHGRKGTGAPPEGAALQRAP
jgi:multidrug efflux system membrane fusion protein